MIDRVAISSITEIIVKDLIDLKIDDNTLKGK